MLKKIMVAYDDGNRATLALQAAIELAKNTSAEIYLISIYTLPDFHVMEASSTDGTSFAAQFEESSRKYMEAIQAEAEEKVNQEKITVRKYIWEGKPGPIITEFAEGLKVDLVVIGSNNRTGMERLFTGSVSNYVLQHASCPVLVIKDVRKLSSFNKILVAYDDSSQAAKALDSAIEIAKKTASEIHLVSAYTLPINYWEGYSGVTADMKASFLETTIKHLNNMQAEALDKVKKENITVLAHVIEGKPGPCIVDLVEELNPDLIVIGAHNRGAVARFFMGSVSNYVLQESGCQVLVVK
ncbi:MAG: hypothetical protein CVU90_14155 [Firmicutes bacterium HGW-Firmicutes-15]|nr:MAG: hypothetical protein CVU90_14155 [Firmicutes bacterium HGW-Firmicutes-15]